VPCVSDCLGTGFCRSCVLVSDGWHTPQTCSLPCNRRGLITTSTLQCSLSRSKIQTMAPKPVTSRALTLASPHVCTSSGEHLKKGCQAVEVTGLANLGDAAMLVS
jgi:hypothetical protein